MSGFKDRPIDTLFIRINDYNMLYCYRMSHFGTLEKNCAQNGHNLWFRERQMPTPEHSSGSGVAGLWIFEDGDRAVPSHLFKQMQIISTDSEHFRSSPEPEYTPAGQGTADLLHLGHVHDGAPVDLPE